MAGNEQLDNIAEVLAKAASNIGAVEIVPENLNRYLTRSTTSTTEQLSSLSAELDQLRQASQQQANVLGENTAAVAQNTGTQGNLSLASVAKPTGSILSSIFGSGFGISPLISGVMSLFGGGSDKSEATAPFKYEKPAAVNYTGGYSRTANDGIHELDYAAGDRLRLLSGAANGSVAINRAWDGVAQVLAQSVPSSSGPNDETSPTGAYPANPILEQLRQQAAASNSRSARDTGTLAVPAAWEMQAARGGFHQGGTTTPQITVQVQAMDSRSFLDHSEDIARAVRQAMLSSHGINDVITEL
ncbi:MAG: hypothetical protein M1541_22270 [Acidobacteria bacterium]|nr:hypothetical protein [Acidobacteriota bacterium]